jgi:proliferating cell nuclear antigen
MNGDSGKLFVIKTLKAVIIKNLVEVVKPYMKETNIRITSDCILISTLDISSQSVTYVKLYAEKFESYYCKEPVTIGINTLILFKVIKSATKNDTMCLSIDENNPDQLNIELVNIIQGKTKVYNIPLLDLEEKMAQLNDLEFDYIINIPTIQFQQIIKDISLVNGEILEIKSVGKQLIFESQDGKADCRIVISEIDESINKSQKLFLQQNGEDTRCVKFTKSTNNIVQGKFKMSYLINFIKASHLCESMNILISNDKPLVLEYFVADLGILRLILSSTS